MKKATLLCAGLLACVLPAAVVGQQPLQRSEPALPRTRDPLAWSPADRCLFVAAIFGTFTLWYEAFFYYVHRNHTFAPYVDRAFLLVALAVQTTMVFLWALLIVAALILRRARQEKALLVPPTLALCSFQLLYGSYFFGIHTSVFSGLTIIASWAVGLILFDRKAVTAAVAATGVALLGISVAEQAGLLPYAPLFLESPFHGGRLDSSWLIGFGGVTLLMMLVIGIIVYFVIERLHDRERKLAMASEQLTRANDVISRYVASQLAEQVRAGNHASLERHERRRLTLFFSDIEDFAVTADLMEPEDLSALLNEYLSEMTAIAEYHGATIDKFVGDAIMIFFGAPAASDDRDQALRAVRMAIEMQNRLSDLRARWGARGVEKPFRVRIGINTGQASVGAFGSRTRLEYTAIGRQVNLAARLQAACEPDRILLSHSTWGLIREEIDCAPKGEISLKGFHQPVKVYEVVRPVPARVGGEVQAGNVKKREADFFKAK